MKRGESFYAKCIGRRKPKSISYRTAFPTCPLPTPNYFKDEFGVIGRQVLLTFGLLSPNKGIEFALRALPDIIEEFPNVVFIVLGQTHPALLREEGEAYRLRLQRLAKDLGVQQHVVFFNRFVELEELIAVHRRGRHLHHAIPDRGPDHFRHPGLCVRSGATQWSPHPTGMRSNYWPMNGAGWFLSRTRRASRRPWWSFSGMNRCAIGLRKNAYKIGRQMVWSRVARLYARSFEQARYDHSFVGNKSPLIKTPR